MHIKYFSLSHSQQSLNGILNFKLPVIKLWWDSSTRSMLSVRFLSMWKIFPPESFKVIVELSISTQSAKKNKKLAHCHHPKTIWQDYQPSKDLTIAIY